MQTLLLLLPVFLSAATIASSKFIEAHTKDVIDPYVLLEKFILLPKQDKVRNEGRFGKAIAAAVQQEIQSQKRPGGMLSPYGAGSA